MNIRFPIQSYSNLKQFVTVSMQGNQPVLSQKSFDPFTGLPLADIVIPIDPTQVQQELTNAQNLVSGLQALLADIQTAKASVTPVTTP